VTYGQAMGMSSWMDRRKSVGDKLLNGGWGWWLEKSIRRGK